MASAWRRERPGEVPAFGENYVQEAQAKAAALAEAGGPPVEWHLVGHLQSNKAALAADLFDWVQSVDSARLATALGRHRDANRRKDQGRHRDHDPGFADQMIRPPRMSHKLTPSDCRPH